MWSSRRPNLLLHDERALGQRVLDDAGRDVRERDRAVLLRPDVLRRRPRLHTFSTRPPHLSPLSHPSPLTQQHAHTSLFSPLCLISRLELNAHVLLRELDHLGRLNLGEARQKVP